MVQNEGRIEVKVVVFDLKIMGLSKDGVSTAFFFQTRDQGHKIDLGNHSAATVSLVARALVREESEVIIQKM